MRVSSFVLLAVLVMLSILPTFEAGSSFFVEAKAGTSSHTKHENMGKSNKKEESTDTQEATASDFHIHSGRAFIVTLMLPDGTEQELMSNECPVPYCVSGDNKLCGTEEQCEDVPVDGEGLHTFFLFLIAIACYLFIGFLYRVVWKMWINPDKPKKSKKQIQREQLRDERR